MSEDAVRVNGHPEQRLPNTLSISFRGVQADVLLSNLATRIAASAGSACHAHDVRLSPVLRAMAVDPEWGMGTLRLSVGRYTTEEEVDTASEIIVSNLVP
jgi:cysteine desulfurase